MPRPKTKKVVRGEVERIRAFVKGLSLDDLKPGDWFAKLLTFSLGKYVEEVDADCFRRKYPDLPVDAVVQERIRMAARYASIVGGLSGAGPVDVFGSVSVARDRLC